LNGSQSVLILLLAQYSFCCKYAMSYCPRRQLAMVSYLRLLRSLWRSFVQVSLQLPRLSFSLLPVVHLQQRTHPCLSEKKTPFAVAFVCLSNVLSLCICGTALSLFISRFLLCSGSHLSHVTFSKKKKICFFLLGVACRYGLASWPSNSNQKLALCYHT
jgi:hypothetical protein